MRTPRRFEQVLIWAVTAALLCACASGRVGGKPAEGDLVKTTPSVTVVEQPPSTATPVRAGDSVPGSDDWLTHTNTGGHFTIRYPADYTFYEDQRPSVDGFVAAAPRTVSVYRASDPGFVLTIEYKQIKEDLSTEAFAQQDDICVTNSDQESDVTLNGTSAIQYTDTLCGPYGSTVLYLVHGVFGYRITVESGTDYQSIEGVIRPILDTFRTEEQ